MLQPTASEEVIASVIATHNPALTFRSYSPFLNRIGSYLAQNLFYPFDSKSPYLYAPVAQLDRATDF